jgi:hypothetical protein
MLHTDLQVLHCLVAFCAHAPCAFAVSHAAPVAPLLLGVLAAALARGSLTGGYVAGCRPAAMLLLLLPALLLVRS